VVPCQVCPVWTGVDGRVCGLHGLQDEAARSVLEGQALGVGAR
jgi:hypothetical protein